MFFRKNYAEPGPGVDPDAPEKTGPARFLEILQLECVTLVKLNLLVLACCIPVITLPPALFAMHQVVRKMMLDEPVVCFVDFRRSFRKDWKRGYAAFFFQVLPLVLSAMGLVFYVPRAMENPLILGPVAVCLLVLALTLLVSPCLYGVLGTGRPLKESLRMALLLGVGKPLRSAAAALSVYGLTLTAVLAFPISLIYVILLGFSAPCFLGSFFLRTLLRDYCPPLDS